VGVGVVDALNDGRVLQPLVIPVLAAYNPTPKFIFLCFAGQISQSSFFLEGPMF
jgi:hypothetical protein